MADWSRPVLTDTYANFLSYLNGRDIDAATMGLAGLPTNPPGFFIKADTTNKQLYYYDTASSSYLPLFGGSWAISITGNAASVSSVTSAQVTSALGFTPLSNAAGSVSSSNIATGGVATTNLAPNAATAGKIAFGVFSTLASAATVDLGAQASRNIQITGTTTISSFGSTVTSDNIPYIVEFASALSITGSANLLLPGGISSGTLSIIAGEAILVVRDSGTVWRILKVCKAFGTSAGQAIALDGTGKLPAVDGSQLTNLPVPASTGRLLRAPQILTSGTSYTTPAGCTAIYVEMVGGGGGGGNPGVTPGYAGSGAGAAYAAKYFSVTANTAYTYAIGAGGTGAGPANGSTGNGGGGGNTTFTVGGVTVTAGGGGGSTDSQATTGGAGGTATNGDINIPGSPGSKATSTWPLNIGGAAPVFGTTTYVYSSQYATQNATGYGSGGPSSGSTSIKSGNGSPGVIRIWEFS